MAYPPRDAARASKLFRPAPGYRDSGRNLFAPNDVLASTYRILGRLHDNAFGQLFEARDLVLDRTVAIQAAWRDPGTPSLHDTVRAMARLRHPAGAQIHGYGHHHKIEYAVLERIEGTPLAALVGAKAPAVADGTGATSGLLHVQRSLRLLAQLARAFEALHNAGLWAPNASVHNVVLVSDDRLVFAEFAFGQGLAQHRRPAPNATINATPNATANVATNAALYSTCLAPELLRGFHPTEDNLAQTTVAVDLYALGCILFEVLTGRPPFVAADIDALKDAHAQYTAPVVSSFRRDGLKTVAGEIDSLAAELLAKDPEERPSSTAQVAKQIDALVARMATARRINMTIIDPQPLRAQQLVHLIQRLDAGTIATAVGDADRAIADMDVSKPDVLIVDTSVNGSMNVLELCMYIRGVAHLSDCLLIVIGDAIAPSDRSAMTKVGADYVISRADNASVVLATTIAQLLRQRA